MNRRSFLKLSAAFAGLTALHLSGADVPIEPHRLFDDYFLQITRGFLRNASKTSRDFVACDFPEGSKLKGCCTPSGKTYTSVARMLPAIAEFVASRPAESQIDVDGEKIDLNDVLLSFFQHALDPSHPDYWGEPPKDKATQRSVEAAMIAESLWRAGDSLIEKLSSQQRTFIQNWLASCTVLPERQTNHAWFSALNQAVRLELSKKWAEFKGNEKWMLDDLAALDGLFVPGNDGWYSDDPKIPIYDYYNFWTFGNFPLFWSRIIGRRYPEWNEKFRDRAKMFLEKTPFFFASNGAHPLMGRSLIYRWALLSPMLLGYEQKLWPHSPGLLRRIVRLSLEYHWKLGAYDNRLGKLRETYSADGTPDVKEAYIDNGHPYWAMQVFTMFALPKDDPFWTEREEPLPIEKDDFTVGFGGPRMMLVGTKRSGHVRWYQARNVPKRIYYRDKYTKFGYSSHFPFSVMLQPKEIAPWDGATIFRDLSTGTCAGREGVTDGELIANGMVTKWWATLNGWRFDVMTTIVIDGEFERRDHEISAPSEGIGKVEILEGSYTLGLSADEKFTHEQHDNYSSLVSPASRHRVLTWNVLGYDHLELTERFGNTSQGTPNLIYPRIAINTLRATILQTRLHLTNIQYASPNPPSMDELLHLAAELQRI